MFNNFNLELALRVRAHIAANPLSFDMDRWATRATHCLGGWAIVLSGIPIRLLDLGEGAWVYLADIPEELRTPILNATEPATVDEDLGETRILCRVVAAFLLGVDYDTANSLFYNDNSGALGRLDDLIATNSKEEPCPTLS